MVCFLSHIFVNVIIQYIQKLSFRVFGIDLFKLLLFGKHAFF